MDEADIVVPRNRINDLVEYTHSLQKEVGVRIKSFGHAGDGNLHAYILKDDLSEEVWKERLSLAMEKMYAKARELHVPNHFKAVPRRTSRRGTLRGTNQGI